MKTSKIIMGALVGLMAVSAVRAEEDMTAKIKTACQKSDKTYWVESTGACIPKNPCKDNVKYSSYCNKMFQDIQVSYENNYMFFVDLDKTLRGLDCEIQPTKAAPSGQDYVPCVGKDVMVYEFDDIDDKQGHLNWDEKTSMPEVALCRILTENGVIQKHGGTSTISKELYDKIHDLASAYGLREGNLNIWQKVTLKPGENNMDEVINNRKFTIRCE